MSQYPDLPTMTEQLEQLRDDHLAGVLDEQRLWRLLADARQMQEKVKGSDIEECVANIYSLLESIWRLSRSQKQLSDLQGDAPTA